MANRYIYLFPKKPSPYFFLAKTEFEKFEKNDSDKVKSKHILSCLKLAKKAQKLGVESSLLAQPEWIKFRKKLKHEAFFFTKESEYEASIERIKKHYYLFVSKGEDTYLLDSYLGLEVPLEQQIDSLFYGTPNGNEKVEIKFAEKEKEMLAYINKARQEKGLQLMRLNTSLSAACRYHAYDMATQNYINHFGQDRGTDDRIYFANRTFDRIRKFYDSSQLLGENISWGQKSAYFTYKRWNESTVHNKIMFNPKNRVVGIGLVFVPDSEKEYYWVLCTAE